MCQGEHEKSERYFRVLYFTHHHKQGKSTIILFAEKSVQSSQINHQISLSFSLERNKLSRFVCLYNIDLIDYLPIQSFD